MNIQRYSKEWLAALTHDECLEIALLQLAPPELKVFAEARIEHLRIRCKVRELCIKFGYECYLEEGVVTQDGDPWLESIVGQIVKGNITLPTEDDLALLTR